MTATQTVEAALACCMLWLGERMHFARLPHLMWVKGAEEELCPESQLPPKWSCMPEPISALSPTALFSTWRVTSVNRWSQGNHNLLLENSSTGRKNKKGKKNKNCVLWSCKATFMVLILIISNDFPRYLISEGVIPMASNVLREKFTALLLS